MTRHTYEAIERAVEDCKVHMEMLEQRCRHAIKSVHDAEMAYKAIHIELEDANARLHALQTDLKTYDPGTKV